jgi:chromosome transmission fidelity protein 8
VLEIQGTIHGPFRTPELEDQTRSPKTSQIGRLEFPLYNPQASNDDGKWMKKVYLYVGKHQRLTGEVKKLGKPLAVIRKVDHSSDRDRDGDSGSNVRERTQDALEIVDVVKFKVLFSGRPEPVGE